MVVGSVVEEGGEVMHCLDNVELGNVYGFKTSEDNSPKVDYWAGTRTLGGWS